MSDIANSASGAANIAMESICQGCGTRYVWRVADDWARDTCANCRTSLSAHTALMSRRDDLRTMLGLYAESPIVVHDLQSLGYEDLLRRFKDLVLEATEPISWRHQGLLDAIFGRDPNALERHKRDTAGAQAGYTLSAIQQCLQLAREHAATQGVILQQQLEARLAMMRAEVERLRLASEAEGIELQRQRAQLEHRVHQQRLLKQAESSSQLPPSRADRLIAEHREKFDTQERAEQIVISDLRQKVNAIYMSDDGDDWEKAHRIEAVLRAYRAGREALPKKARRLLERIDKELDE